MKGSVNQFSQKTGLPRNMQGWAINVFTLALLGCGGGGGGVTSSNQDPDPVVVDLPIAFVSRTLPADDNGNLVPDDTLDPSMFNPGAQLILKDRASPSATETVITNGVFPDGELYDVKGLESSFDGERLLFSMRAPEIPNADDDEQPTWNIWEYDIPNQQLRRIITSDIIAEGGHDIAPHYLPGGRILFVSSRQRDARAILLDEGKPQFSGQDEDRQDDAFVLHVMESDGSNIRQLTFNQSHDLHPTVLESGKVLFSRWDNVAGNNSISLYQINPDGTGLEFVYGFHSQDTGTNNSNAQFLQPRQSEDGRILVSLRPRVTSELGGEIALVDVDNYTEVDQPVFNNSGATGPGQVSASLLEITTDGSPSPHGHISSAFPLNDGTGRLLVSWSQCRLEDPVTTDILPCSDSNLQNPALVNAPPLYGIWSYDIIEERQLPIVTGVEGQMFSDAVALIPRAAPTFIPDKVIGVDLDADLVSENVGVLHIRSVYDFDGVDTSPLGIPAMADPLQATGAERPARFLRIVKAVSMPDDDLADFAGTAFGRSAAQLMREIIGYTPIHPDGSVKVKVPANIPFAISILDADGRRITPRHQNWLQLKPGEERECSGCHTATSELPHGRADAEAPSVNTGAATTGIPFPNTNSALFADMGETMAETLSRINGVEDLSVDVQFSDVWTDTALRAADPDISLLYGDMLTSPPTSLACQTAWTSQCRTVIHYPDHIQPLWDRDRRQFDVDGVTVLDDFTCTACHTPTDAVGVIRDPVQQLDLRGVASADEPDHFISYRELLFPDFEQEEVNGVLQDVMVQATDGNGNLLFQTNPDGSLALDINGDPIPIMVPVSLGQRMSTAGALASLRFFVPFDAGGTHEGYMDDAELRLISEWLDIGAQYYNNPFDAPLN